MPVDTLHPDQFFGQKAVMKAFVWGRLVWTNRMFIPCITATCFALIYFIIRIRDNKPIIRQKVEPKLPPHQAAMKEIERIKNEKVWQKDFRRNITRNLQILFRTYIKIVLVSMR